MINAYVLSNCQRCEELKAYMRKNGIAYQELNVESNPRALARMTMEGIDQYPVVEIDGRLYDDDVSALKRIVSAGM